MQRFEGDVDKCRCNTIGAREAVEVEGCGDELSRSGWECGVPRRPVSERK